MASFARTKVIVSDIVYQAHLTGCMTSTTAQCLLFFVLLKCTRGVDGVRTVSEYILANWAVYVTDFDELCIGLIRHCEEVCEEKGKTYLSHREGLHAAYSGIHFVRTLGQQYVRNRLVSFSMRHASIFRAVFGDRDKGITSREILYMGNNLRGYVALAMRSGRHKMCGPYNSMDTIRCLMYVLHYGFKTDEIPYDSPSHSWFLSRQKRNKLRTGSIQTLQYFGVQTHGSMMRAIQRMRDELPGSAVNFASMYVLYCETRQAIKKYSINGVYILIHEYVSRKEVRDVAGSVRMVLRNSRVCHTIRILEAIRIYLKLESKSLYDEERMSDRDPASVAHLIGKYRICPKVDLSAVPEWVEVADCMKAFIAKVNSNSNDTVKRIPTVQKRFKRGILSRPCEQASKRLKRGILPREAEVELPRRSVYSQLLRRLTRSEIDATRRGAIIILY